VVFNNTMSYHVPGDSFTNHEVGGTSHWDTHLQNTSDDSHAPVYGLGLEFDATVELGTNIRKEYAVSAVPPTYKWFFGDVPEEPQPEVYRSEAYVESATGTPFSPGFDASIAADKTTFSEPGTQTTTITIIPRVTMTSPGFVVHTQGGPHGNVADVDMLGPTAAQQQGLKGEIVAVSPDKKDLLVENLPLKVGQAYTFAFTVNVKPHQANTSYSPYISINWNPRPSAGTNAGGGTSRGSSLTWVVDKAGKWTWSANGVYQFQWNVGNVYEVDFNG
jgi:hypothetical protein